MVCEKSRTESTQESTQEDANVSDGYVETYETMDPLPSDASVSFSFAVQDFRLDQCPNEDT